MLLLTEINFGSVNKSYLWLKLLKHAIDGEKLKINNNLCANAKSCVTVGHLKSELLCSTF